MRRTSPAVLFVLSLLIAGPARGLPVFGEAVSMRQPDGRVVEVRIWGDEYYQHVEDMAGYTLVRDPQTGWICYADHPAGTDDLRSTGVAAHLAPPAHLHPGLRLPADLVAEKVAARRITAGAVGTSRSADGGEKISYPLPAVHGEVRGIALLVDFSDQPATWTPAEVAAMLNERGYSLYGNNGSVRDYFHDISGGRLDLQHEVTPYYYRAGNPKEWYESPYVSQGWRARQLVTEALEELARRGFDFSKYDSNGDGFVDLVSCFYAGSPAWGWGTGLWPQAGEGGFSNNGVVARLWQITPLGNTLRIGTACHEIGHALNQWADLYDLDGSSYGIGLYCVMSNPGLLTNPVEPCGPLKYLSGWTDSILLDGVMPGLQAPVEGNRVFVLPHPSISNELYVIENRRRAGRDSGLPDEGLAVWHVDWRGSNSREVRLPDYHYMVTLVQADGRWDLEHRVNMGDATDLFKAPDFTSFSPGTSPAALWWRGQDAPLYLDNIGAPGDTVTFDYRDGIGRYPVQLTISPADLPAGWRIYGADGYVKTGAGNRLTHVPAVGSYLIDWQLAPGWQAPPPATVLVPDSGPVPEVVGHYTHPPFTPVEVPALAGAAPGRGGQVVDFDGDGRLDLFLCREGEGDLLLRNEGGWQFSDATPPALAAPGPSLAVAFADIDGVGRQDCYVVRRGEPDLLLRQTAPGVFADEVELAPGHLTAVRGAAWLDIDGNGRLDLHLVRDGVPDLVLRPPGRGNARLSEYDVLDILPGLTFARTVAGAWCDYDGDGRPDLYMINQYGQNVLVRNEMPDRLLNTTHGGLRLPWRGGAAAWGDYDNDGDFDLYVAQDGAADMLFTQYEGLFVLEPDLDTRTPGQGKDVVWADFDNDGWLDLFLVRHGQPCRLLLNNGGVGWIEAPLLLDDLDGPAVAVLAGDFDRDGGIDLVLDRDGQAPVVLRNTMVRGNWLQVDPRGFGGLRDPYGAVLRAHVGPRVFTRQVAARSGPSRESTRVHFGLGAATAVDSLTIRWPSGDRQVLREIEVNQILAVVQPPPNSTGSQTVPTVTMLRPAWPNPFNPATNLSFDLARGGKVRLAVYDLSGRLVATLHDGDLAAGRHAFRWEGRGRDGRRMASSVYLAMLAADGRRFSERLVLVK